MEKFSVVKDTVKKIRKYNLTGRTLEFKLKPMPQDSDPLTWVKSGIKDIVDKITQGTESTDQIGFTFCSKEFSRGEGWVPFRPASEVTFEDIWSMISSVYQSNSTGLDTETFCLGATSVKMPKGSGRVSRYNTYDAECAKRKGIITIKNKDHLCLARAIVVAKAYADDEPDKKRIREVMNIQTMRTRELLEKSGVEIPKEGGGIPELEKLQDYLSDYKITVYNYGNKGRDVLFEGVDGVKKINLLYHEQHYNVILSLTAAFCSNYYCEDCHVSYQTKEAHRCSRTCPCCQQAPPCPFDEKVLCATCNRNFRAQECFNKHITSKLCEKIGRCDKCLKTFLKNRQHTCGEIYCKVCKGHKPSPHNCFMCVDTGKPSMSGVLFIFYDLESTQEELTSDGSLLHKPNLCVYQQHCEECIGTDIKICCSCGVRQQVLKIEPVARFMEYVMNIRFQFKKIIVIGHAGGLYDNQFMLNHILTSTNLKPELITQGTKLLLMSVENVNFIDSLNYFPMPLAKLPKALGLDNVKKGYFPHLFNKAENWQYVGPLPALEYYDPDSIKYTPTLDEEKDARKQLIDWHRELSEQEYIFNFQKELVEYCMSDVDILSRACIKFRELMIKEGGVDPFIEAITLPGACNKIFRRNFLKPNTIGLIPKNGYRWRDNQSKIAIQWLVCEELQRGIKIHHAGRGPEISIANMKVDGFCQERNQIFEFHGCYFHGCPKCIKYRRNDFSFEDPTNTIESRYEATLAKTERLRALGYEVVEKWECDFRKELLENLELRMVSESHPFISLLPLDPRDAFYGGRTDATKMYYKCKEGETIKYADVCSLYPFINKYGKYPIGHPEVFVGDECNKLDLHKTDGIIKCRVLPPQNMYHPVLPVKVNNKLMFSLCRSCCEKMSDDDDCTHSDEERILSGTWVMDELLKALEKGYRMVEIYEIWKYEVVQYNPNTKSGGLFSEYISKFLKIKQQASGWPGGCVSDEQKRDYIREYFDKEGVSLCAEEIELNPGCRQIGKSLITSFWGKLGQRENQLKTQIINQAAEFFDILSKPFIEVSSIFPVNENTLIVNWLFKDEAYSTLPTVNVVLAAYTTAQARLKLYSYLENLDTRVLYHDTDSVIYISRPGEYEVPLGSFLGEMTDELSEYGKGSFITDFVSGGPKLYAYRVYSTLKNKTLDIIKVKGITLNYNTHTQVNFEKLRDMILTAAPDEYITTQNILRKTDHTVVTKEVTKVFRTNFTKRKRIDNYDSVPYGFKKSKL